MKLGLFYIIQYRTRTLHVLYYWLVAITRSDYSNPGANSVYIDYSHPGGNSVYIEYSHPDN